MTALGIDPGTDKSAWCLLDCGRVTEAGIARNAELSAELPLLIERLRPDRIGIEMIASYGMAVGREVFATCWWSGRFFEAAFRTSVVPEMIERRLIKLHLCGSARAKDGNIRQALIDKHGAVGTKKAPGPLYGVSSHVWAALAVADYVQHN
jgi:hypothetical protein